MTTAIILGAAVWKDGPSPTLTRRTQHGADLFHAGLAGHVLVCGGLGQHAPSEADAMAEILRKAAVPSDCVTREDKSTTTGENLSFALPLLRETDVILVTDWYHAPRALLVARRLGLSATASCPPLTGAKPWPQIKGALREVPAYLAYLLRLRS